MNWYQDDAELDRQLRQEILAEPADVSAVEQRIRKAIAPRFSRRLLVAASGAFLLLLCAFAFIGLRTWFPLQLSQVCSDAARDHLREIVRREPRRWTSDTAGIDALGQQLGVSPAAHSNSPSQDTVSIAANCAFSVAACSCTLFTPTARESSRCFWRTIQPPTATLTRISRACTCLD